MGARGTKLKPTALKVLEGNPGKRPININEVKPIPIPDKCPDWLSDYAKEYWDEYSEKLERLGLLTEVDGLDFQNMCIAAGDVKELTIFINENGFTTLTVNGGTMARPEVNARYTAMKLINAITAKFGMTPSDRVGLISTKPEDGGSKMSKLLKGQNGH